MKRLVLVPTYNERENLAAIAEALLALEPAFDVLLVDDASPDGTGALADEIAASEERFRVLHRPRKEGLGRAYLHAFEVALAGDAEQIFHMDCDFSHPPDRLPALAAALETADVAIGSRYIPGGGVEGWGPLRIVISGWGSFYSRLFLGLRIRDLTGGFKGFRRCVLEAIDRASIRSVGYSFQVEMTYRAVQAGFAVQEVPIHFVDRTAGKSKMNAVIALEAAWRVPLLRLGGRVRA